MTDFENAKEIITPFLKDYQFFVVENYKYYVRYESTKVSIAVGYDERDHNYFTIVGDKLNIAIPLDVNNLTNVFQYDTKFFIQGTSFETFFMDFFKTKGKPILTGDVAIIEALKMDRDKRAEEYTKQLLKQQNLKAADKAWISKNYREFVRHLDLIDKAGLIKSYEMKYAIAIKKLKE